MRLSERMVTGSIGVILVLAGLLVARMVSWSAFGLALAALLFLSLGGVCVFGALTEGERDGY